MLFKNHILTGIADGTVTIAFRRWIKARVNEGSRLHTSIGLLEITSVVLVSEHEITESDANQAGFATRKELIKEINSFSDVGNIYRLEVTRIGADPREALREEDTIDGEGYEELLKRLDRLDRASPGGPWTKAFLFLINDHPGTRSTDLAAIVQWEQEKLKLNVRKLKNLGLTISLGTGYQISPRGKALLDKLSTLNT